MKSLNEGDLSGRSQVKSKIIGDPDDHDFAVAFEPSKQGCLGWTILGIVTSAGGTLLLNNNLPEGEKLTQHGFELLAIWGMLPVVYASGIISWLTHLDLEHYDCRTDHIHSVTKVLKAPIYAARSLKDWSGKK